MERHDLLAMMLELHLAGMRAAYDEVMADGIRRQHSAERILGDLLKAEVAEKQARSISYRIGAAKLPLAMELAVTPALWLWQQRVARPSLFGPE